MAYTRSWIVLTTHPHREGFAEENLVRQRFRVYCPMIAKRVRHARRVLDVRRPLFPGYIFVEHSAGDQTWRPVLGTYGVRSVVCNGNNPAFLPAGFVESLRSREVDGVFPQPELRFRQGQAVVIDGGPFDGLVGQILEVRESDRVLLLLNLLNQQAKVHMDVKMLRAV